MAASVGRPAQRGSLFRSKLRGTPAPRAGVPYPAGNPACRVSTSLHGETPTNATPGVTSAIVVIPPRAELAWYGGTVQFVSGMSTAKATLEMRRTARTTRPSLFGEDFMRP